MENPDRLTGAPFFANPKRTAIRAKIKVKGLHYLNRKKRVEFIRKSPPQREERLRRDASIILTPSFPKRGNKKANVTAGCVFGNFIARAKSFDSMFGVRSASVAPPRAAQPNVGSLQYRGKLGGRVGREGREGRKGGWGREGREGTGPTPSLSPHFPLFPRGEGREGREGRDGRDGREGREVSS